MEMPQLGAEDLWAVRQAGLRCLAVQDLDEVVPACVDAVRSVLEADDVRVVCTGPGPDDGADPAPGRDRAARTVTDHDGPVDLPAGASSSRIVAMEIPVETHATMWIEIERGAPGFDARDRSLLHCLQAHLAAAVGRAVLVTSLRETVEAASGSTVTVDRGGVVRHLTETASAILGRHLPEALEVGRTLPDALRALVGEGAVGNVVLSPTQSISAVVTSVPAETVDVLHVREVSHERPVAVLERELRLSRRQAEVLLLLSEGSTDRQIAGSLDISVHTVRKHIELVFRRIDVPNRTLAAQVCRSVLAAAATD